jgi:hypothetical protein
VAPAPVAPVAPGVVPAPVAPVAPGLVPAPVAPVAPGLVPAPVMPAVQTVSADVQLFLDPVGAADHLAVRAGEQWP